MQQFADWGVDHISVDNCGHPDGNAQSVLEYTAFHDALVKVGKPMVYVMTSERSAAPPLLLVTGYCVRYPLGPPWCSGR